jgi:mRNA-degrading endonuclease RelE of RelBE toxin-antitoxin system
MNWILKITETARKDLLKIPQKDADRIQRALYAMQVNPFKGDIKKLNNYSPGWRRRVGNYMIFYDLYHDFFLIVVVSIKRRSSNTY